MKYLETTQLMNGTVKRWFKKFKINNESQKWRAVLRYFVYIFFTVDFGDADSVFFIRYWQTLIFFSTFLVTAITFYYKFQNFLLLYLTCFGPQIWLKNTDVGYKILSVILVKLIKPITSKKPEYLTGFKENRSTIDWIWCTMLIIIWPMDLSIRRKE